MPLYERLKELQKFIGSAVQVNVAGRWTDGRIQEIYIGKEIKVTVSVGPYTPTMSLEHVGVVSDEVSTIQNSASIELVGIDEIYRRLIG